MSTKNLFEIAGVSKRYKVTKPIRLIELFAGIGAQAAALERLGANFEHYRVCEFDKYAIASYNAVHGTNFETSDIREIHASDLGIVETDKYEYLMTYSFPCYLYSTKVYTSNGYKNIGDIHPLEYVVTHNNRFMKVVKKMVHMSDHYYVLSGTGVTNLKVTGNHPLYIYRDGEFKWIPVRELTLSDKFTFNINTFSEDVDLDESYLWLLGRYVADGWINPKHYNSVAFAIGYDKESDFLNHIPNNMADKFRRYKKSCAEYRIADAELQNYCKQFGSGAKNKIIPNWVINLPKNKLQSFFDGYFSGDGHIRKDRPNTYMFATVSEELFLSMQQIVAKLYNCVCSCYVRHDKRKDTFNDCYQAQFVIASNRRNQVVIGDKILTSITSIRKVDACVPVYNIEVEDDHSYTANNVISKNCTDLSVAGKQAGMSRDSGTRSGLLWEVERLLKDCGTDLPQILLMENVTQVHSEKFLPDFLDWINFLESLGYSNFYQDMNAKDYGVAQSRNRTFMVSILGNYTYTFPNPIPLKKRMRDYLETSVDDKYYIRSEKAMQLIQKLIDSSDLSQPQSACDMTVNNPSTIDIANCITARYDSGISNLAQSGTGVVETGIVQNLATPDPSVEAEFKSSDVAGCLAAREYKGFSNWGSNAVVTEKKQTDSCE